MVQHPKQATHADKNIVEHVYSIATMQTTQIPFSCSTCVLKAKPQVALTHCT